MQSFFRASGTVVVIASLLGGCAATEVALTKRNLDVQTRMSDTIFLDPAAPKDMVMLIQLRNTSDKPDFTIASQVEQALTARGWKITRDPDQAKYMLQANILQVGKSDPSAANSWLGGGYGGAMTGAAIAYSASRGSTNRDIVGGALIAGAVDFVSGALVKDVYYSAITDIQVSQRSKTVVKVKGKQIQSQGNSGAEMQDYQEDSNWKRYRTRVLSSANKVNLTWEVAQPELVKGLVNAVSGML